VTQLGGFVLTELNKSGHHEGVDDVAEIDQLSQELEAHETYNLLRQEIKTRMLRIVHERVAKRKSGQGGDYIPTKQELLEILSSIKIAVDDQIATTIRGAERLKPKTGGPNDYISLDMRVERARLSAWEAEVLREDRRAAMMHTRIVNVAKETGSNETIAMAWNNYAAFCTRQRNFAYALSCVDNAIAACPRLRSPYIIAASIRIEQGQFIDALGMLKQGESIAQDVAVKHYFEGCIAEREDLEDLEVARALQAFVYRKIGDDDRCILAINRIGNGDLNETIEKQALGKPREWGLVSPDPSVTVDVLQVAAQHLVELRLGFSGQVALQMSKAEEIFPSNTELDRYKNVEGNRRMRYDAKAQMIRARESPISLWASQIIMRDLTRWPPNTEEERDEDEGETIDMLYDPEQFFAMTTFQRWQHDLLLGRCINIQLSCENPGGLGQSVEMAKTLFQGVIDAAEKAKDQIDILLQSHIHLAEAYYNDKNLIEATASIEEALRIAGGASGLFDQDPKALFMFGMTAEMGDKWSVARNAYTCIVKEDKRMTAARRKVGYTNCMLGEWDETIDAFNGAVTLDPLDASSWFLLTKAHLKNKDLEAANVCFDRAVKTENNCFDAELLAELAQMFGRNERGKLAVTWEKAMRKANTTTSILNLTNAQPK
jgi:tetratricopeptide (TPR) repeat protein